MRIAYIVPYVPNHIRTRSYNLINQLSRLGHKVTVFTLGSNEMDLAAAKSLRAACQEVYCDGQPTWQSFINCAVALPTNTPLQSVYSWNPGVAQKWLTLLQKEDGELAGFDIIHVEHLRGSRYGTFLKPMLPAIPIVWDSVDCISYLFQQAAAQSGSLFGKTMTRFELGRTRKAEGELVGSFDRVLVTSAADKQALMELVPAGKQAGTISVLPNGVDLEYFRPDPSVRRDPQTIVFSGKMSYHANVSMVKYLVAEIMPEIWKHCPKAELIIVGKDPPANILSLATNPLITVTGTVDDIRPFLWQATVAVVPLVYGAGIQNKILEAMATGTPVVTTSRAVSALRATAGRDLLVADRPTDFAQSVAHLLVNRKQQREIGENGLRYVQKYHDWAAVASQLVDEYTETILNFSNL